MSHKLLKSFAIAEEVLLKNGRIVNPAQKLDTVADIHIKNGKIIEIGSIESKSCQGKEIDCGGLVITPGFFDMHVHLREPGQEEKETIESGCRAAMTGGFTGVCAMPNTKPPIDSRSHIEFIRERSKNELVEVFQSASITMEQKGETLTEMGDLANAGAVAFTDDGHPVEKAGLFRRALEYANMVGRVIIDHAEELSLSDGGVMNEGAVSTALGMKGICPLNEVIAVSRDIMLAEYTGAPIHIAHVSTAGAVQIIRDAKARGVRVSAETCPHYLTLTDESVRSFDTNLKMNPPLRTGEDQAALIRGLQDGTIDVVSTDHAPHTVDDKEVEFNVASFGILGLETSIGLILTHLFHSQKLSLEQIIERMSVNPRKVLSLLEIKFEKGESVNLTLLDLNREWTVDKTQFQSNSVNSPFHGWKLKGRAVGVIRENKLFWEG